MTATTHLWIVYTVAGAALASGLAFFLRTQRDSARVLIGRSLGSLCVGTLGSRVSALFHPPILTWTEDPIILVAFGLVFGLVGYLISLPLVNLLDSASPNMAKGLMKLAPKLFARVLKAFGLAIVDTNREDRNANSPPPLEPPPNSPPVPPPGAARRLRD